jgi:hypothetical protein
VEWLSAGHFLIGADGATFTRGLPNPAGVGSLATRLFQWFAGARSVTISPMDSDANSALERPEILPLPIASFKSYARSSNPDVMFGWSPDGFRVTAYNGPQIQEREFPVTELGWVECWNFISSEYPDLASHVSSRTKTAFKRRMTPTPLSDARRQVRRENVLADLGFAVLLGGYGFGRLTPGARVLLDFTTKGLRARSMDTHEVLLESLYKDARTMEFSGPGRVEKGGGFFGGGFGLKGAAEGMVVASVLNAVTRRAEIQSMIRWEAEAMEAFFFTSVATPAELRIKLSGVLARIAPNSKIRDQSSDKLSKIERLASLFREGLLSEDEFSALKRDIVRNE